MCFQLCCFMYKTFLRVAFFCLVSTIRLSASEISLPTADFSFDITVVSEDSRYQPVMAFVSDGKTYIKFTSLDISSHLPKILVDHIPGHDFPEIHDQAGYVVINQPAKEIRIYDPKTEVLLYQMQRVKKFNYDVVPPPPMLADEYAGYFAGVTLAAASINNSKYVPAFSFQVGYDWSFYQGLLVGLELGIDYNGKSTKDNITVKSYDIAARLRAEYLFESGFDVVARGGFAYVKNSQTGNTNSIGNGFAPTIGIGVGYLFKNRLGLQLKYDRLISNSKVNPVNIIGIGAYYRF